MTNFKSKDLKTVCNDFNQTFINQSQKLKTKYNRPKGNSFQGKNVRSFPNSMIIISPEENEILKILQDIKTSGALGHDGFYIDNFKKSAENSAKFINYLIKCIISTESWPDNLKIQTIRHIIKNNKAK